MALLPHASCFLAQVLDAQQGYWLYAVSSDDCMAGVLQLAPISAFEHMSTAPFLPSVKDLLSIPFSSVSLPYSLLVPFWSSRYH